MTASARFLSAEQAAAYIGVSMNTLHLWRKAGVGPPYLTSGAAADDRKKTTRVYPLAGLEAWIVERTTTPSTDYVIPDDLWEASGIGPDKPFADLLLDLAAFGLPWSSAAERPQEVAALRAKALDWLRSGLWSRLQDAIAATAPARDRIPFRFMVQIVLSPRHDNTTIGDPEFGQNVAAGPGLVLAERDMTEDDIKRLPKPPLPLKHML